MAQRDRGAVARVRSHRGTTIGLLALLSSLFVVGLGYLAAVLVADDRVPVGTTVAGVDIGGLRPGPAARRLDARVGSRSERPLEVAAARARLTLDPVRAGLRLDVGESVAQAGGRRSWSPVRLWEYFTGGTEYPAVVTVDAAKVRAALDPLAAKVERPAREGSIRFDASAEPVGTPPRVGRELDREGAPSALRDALLATRREVVLPVVNVPPAVSARDVRRAVKQVAFPATSAPVLLAVGSDHVALRPREFSRALSVPARNGSFRIAVDRPRLLRLAERRLRSVLTQPRDATVRLVDGRPKVVPGKAGSILEARGLSWDFLEAVTSRGRDRRVVVDTEVVPPDFTTADARELRINEVVSSFTTAYPHADYRNTNIGRAAELVDGTLLLPGETFTLNGTVGERTAANGFAKGFVISNGIFKEDYGGGVSQVATTLFNAAFFAGLEDVEHKPHSFYIDRYPVGREATVAWGSVDLRFRNNTPYGVLIEATIEPSSPETGAGTMNVRMWSTEYWDVDSRTSDRYSFTSPSTRTLSGADCTPNQGYGGFDVDVYRILRRLDGQGPVRREKLHTTYTPSDSVVCTP